MKRALSASASENYKSHQAWHRVTSGVLIIILGSRL